MKKYNLSKIMKRAWELKRKNGMGRFADLYSFGKCLKMAWGEAKLAMIAAEQAALDEAQKGATYHNGIEITVGWATYTVNRWSNYGKDRLYVNRGRSSIGYIDLLTGDICNKRGIVDEERRALEIAATLKIA